MNPEYEDLLNRIVKGADFISSINNDHYQWEIANEKYNELCEEALKIRRQED